MGAEIRKLVTITEEIRAELGRPVDVPVRKVAVGVVVRNPWHRAGAYVEDLRPLVAEVAPLVAAAISRRVLAALDGADGVQAFGKAAIVGLDGEIEHGAALIHTPHFGDLYRRAVDGTAIIAFSERRGPAGTDVAVPIWHKTASATRSHYQTIDVRIPDAPHADEIVVVGAASSGPRPNARIGDRTTDRAEAAVGAAQ
jgi:hypothetical protein